MKTKGVHWVPERKRWSARVMRRGARFFLGYFKWPEDAIIAIKEFKERHKSSPIENNNLKPTTTN